MNSHPAHHPRLMCSSTRNVVTFVKWTRLSHSTVYFKLTVFGVLLGYLRLHASPVHFTNVTTRRVQCPVRSD